MDYMKRLLFAILAFTLLISPAYAISFDKFSQEISVRDSTSYESISFEVSPKERITEFSLSLPIKPEGLNVEGSNYTLKEGEQYIATFLGSFMPGNTYEISLSFQSKDRIIRISENEYSLSIINNDLEAKSLSLKAILPEEATILDRGGLLVSRPVFISTDGKRIVLEWNKKDVSGDTEFVYYKTRQEQQGVYLFLIPLVLLLGVFIGHRITKFKKSKLIKQVVSGDEKKIVDELMEKGELLQEDLRESTGFSKTKISKLVRNLEMKGIITKVPYKKTNKLKIK